MGKNNSKLVNNNANDSRNLKKLTTRRLKLGIKFGKDVDGGIEAGLACGYEKRTNRFFDSKNSDIEVKDTAPLLENENK